MNDNAMERLRKRYASGEINNQEFDEIATKLS
jgi:uncharacterized membrane protein